LIAAEIVSRGRIVESLGVLRAAETDAVARRLIEMPGPGPIGATAIRPRRRMQDASGQS
jgi:hypothetical protein